MQTHPLPPSGPSAPAQPPIEPAAVARLEAVLQSQPVHSPRPELRQELLQRIQRPTLASQALHGAGILGLALITLLLLWATLRPGVELRWTVETGEVSTFRVYRVDARNYEFKLIDEVPAHPNATQYSLIDPVLLPGQQIEYIVEGLNEAGMTVQQQTTVGNVLPILLGQIAMILASLVLAVCCVYLLQLARQGELHLPQLSLVN